MHDLDMLSHETSDVRWHSMSDRTTEEHIAELISSPMAHFLWTFTSNVWDLLDQGTYLSRKHCAGHESRLV